MSQGIRETFLHATDVSAPPPGTTPRRTIRTIHVRSSPRGAAYWGVSDGHGGDSGGRGCGSAGPGGGSAGPGVVVVQKNQLG